MRTMPRFDLTIAGEINLDLILYGVPKNCRASANCWPTA